MESVITDLVNKLQERIERSEAKGKTVTLKLKYFDFESHTRSSSFAHYTDTKNDILQKGLSLLNHPPPEKPVRLFGIGLSNLETEHKDEYVQLTLNF